MNKEQLQLEKYKSLGAYHRKSLRLPFHPRRLRYDLSKELLPNSLLGAFCCDFGGGDGAMATIIANLGAKVVVVDQNLLPLTFAQDGDQRLILVNAKTRLPFPEKTFNIVTMLEILEHINDREEILALEESSRVLVEGGSLVISVPSTNLRLKREHYRHYHLSDILAKLYLAGFRVKETISHKDPLVVYGGSSFPARIIRGVAVFYDWYNRRLYGNNGLFICGENRADCHIVLAEKL